ARRTVLRGSMRIALLIALIGCTPPRTAPTPATTTPATTAPAAAGETKVGWLNFNGRCPEDGITFSENEHADPVDSTNRICALVALESQPLPEDAKHEAIKKLTGKHVKITYTKVDEGTIRVTAVEDAP